MNGINISINIPGLILISITLLAIGVCLFLIGYLIGNRRTHGVSNNTNKKTTNFFEEQKSISKAIEIDHSKYVVNIQTEGLEKKYESLGEVKESQENITESINKLKNLKR
jgi:hypothetical protein